MGTYNDENPNGLDSNGWRTVLFDGFNGGSVDRDNWPVLYGGGSGNGGAFQWSNDDVRVGDGELTVSMTNRGGWWSAGGLSQGWEGQTYGRFEVRAKVDQGQGTSGAIVMWPTDNSYPPEVDLLETPEGNRSQAHFTYHWDAGYDAYESHGYDVDTSQWHTSRWIGRPAGSPTTSTARRCSPPPRTCRRSRWRSASWAGSRRTGRTGTTAARTAAPRGR
jgi:beta-glucanase (GH16 family)